MKSINKENYNNGLPLPPANTARWVKSRKKAVIEAIEKGELSDETACTRYGLSPEELTSWKIMMQKFGPDALRATHIKQYRGDETVTSQT